MKTIILSLLGLSFLPPLSAQEQKEAPSSNFLWYKTPAPVDPPSSSAPNHFDVLSSAAKQAWETQALPIGNGRIGAMVFGGTKRERLALNEISFWSGGLNPGGGYDYGPEANENKMGAFQPFADLLIDFKTEGEVTDYTRSLNLGDAVSAVTYTQNGVEYKREAFASFPHQVIVMTYTASKPGALSASFALKPNHKTTTESRGNELSMSGQLANGQEFEGKVVIKAKGGTTKAVGGKKEISVIYKSNQAVFDEELPSIEVDKADSITVIISLATDYVMDYGKKWKGEKPAKRNQAYLSKAAQIPAEELKKAHIANYRSLYDRVKLDLGKTEKEVAALPTNERIQAYKSSKNDPELEETLFQYGRYALISSSRPGSLPANLQGLWNDSVAPAWASDYHSNINIQMNYWLAESSNLSECQQPLIDFFEGMEEPSRIATLNEPSFKSHDGKPLRGWTVRTSQNPFGGQGWAWNIPASAWYARHIWEHYIFTLDNKYLKEQAYPMMKDISHFWEDHLKPLGKDGEGFQSDGKPGTPEMMAELKGIKAGTLVAPNGWSPEHGPREDGVSHDQQLIWDLFTNTAMAANILGVDKQWAASLLKKRDMLAGPKIGKEGNLQEWMIDRIAKTQHRHTSHLYAVYPGNQISMEKTPELAKAAMNSLEWRGSSGDSQQSWTWAWRCALWARFLNGEKAHEMISGLIEHNLFDNMLAHCTIGGWTPMQMDGTYGITAGMAEMLIQSHNLGEIAILPAPTKAWPTGSVKGIKARGNVTADFSWKDGQVTAVKLYSPNPRPLKVTYNGKTVTMTPSPLPGKTPVKKPAAK